MEKSISKYWSRKRSLTQSWHSGNQHDHLLARTTTRIRLFNVLSILAKFWRACWPVSTHIRHNINKKENNGQIKKIKNFVRKKVKRKWKRCYWKLMIKFSRKSRRKWIWFRNCRRRWSSINKLAKIRRYKRRSKARQTLKKEKITEQIFQKYLKPSSIKRRKSRKRKTRKSWKREARKNEKKKRHKRKKRRLIGRIQNSSTRTKRIKRKTPINEPTNRRWNG